MTETVAEPAPEVKLGFTGRTRRRWFLFTQYEYAHRCFVGGKWQNPWNVDKWPVGYFWEYKIPAELHKNSVGLIEAWKR